MSNPEPTPPVERLFPFVLRARILIIGRERLQRIKGRLHFVLITTDLAEATRAGVLADFAHYPVVQHYTAPDLEKYFGVKGARVVGFAKSGLAQSLYAELKSHRVNRPVDAPKPAAVTPPPRPAGGPRRNSPPPRAIRSPGAKGAAPADRQPRRSGR
jgi:hypothetical protein